MSAVFINILEISLSGGIIIILILLLSPWLNKTFSAKWKYWLWLALAIRLLLPFQISLPEAFFENGTVPPSSILNISIPDAVTEPFSNSLIMPIDNASQAGKGQAAISSTSFQENAATTAVGDSLSILDIAAWFWLVGVIAFIFWHMLRYFQSKKNLARWRRLCSSPMPAQICVELGIKNVPPLYTSCKAAVPMMIGFFRPFIYLPEEEYEDDDLYFILKHELIHWKRRDIWYKLLLLISCAAHWFNPLVHLAFRSTCRDLEMACDEEVIAREDGKGRQRYSEAIFFCMQRQVFHPTELSTYFNGGVKTMKQRFINIFSCTVKRRGRAALIAALLLLVAAGGLIACTMEDADTSIRELVVEESEESREFTLNSDFSFTLGRQFGEYPWGDFSRELPEPKAIGSGDYPGMNFYEADLGSYMDSGNTRLQYYVVEESGYTYINYLHTNDPYVITLRGAKVGDSEEELFSLYEGELTENTTLREINENYALYKIYEYAPSIFEGERIIRFYLADGKINIIEMHIELK